MSRMRLMANRREIRKLMAASIAQVHVISNPEASESQKEVAAQRLAEIKMRIQLLKDENDRL